MARTIVGQLVVNLIDGVSGKAKAIAGSLKDIDKAVAGVGRWSAKPGAVDDLASSLKKAEKAARDLVASGKDLDGWGSRFNSQLTRLKASTSEIDSIREAWKRLQDTLRAGSLDNAFRTNAIRQWQAQTIGALAAARREAERHDRAITATSVARLGRNALVVAGGVPTAYGAQRLARYGVTHGAELPREGARQYMAGMSAEETAVATAKARELSTRYPSMGQVAIMEHIRQLRSRFGDFPHAMEGVETLVKAQVMLQNLKGGEHAGHDLERLVLGLEALGTGADPKKFQQYLDAFVKAKSLFQDLRGEDFRQYLQTSKASKYGLSDDYLTNVVPTMMQHEGAAKFGTMQATAFGAMVGLRMKKRSAAQLFDYDLVQDFSLDSKGNKVIEKIKGEDELISNPYKWALDTLQPALAGKGITFEGTREKFVSAVTKIFSDRNAAEFFTTLLANKSVIEKDRAMLATAKGTEAAPEVREKDPFVAFEGVKQQFINVVQNALEPQAARATAALNSVADALARLANMHVEKRSVFEPYAKKFAGDLGDTSVTKLLFKPFEFWKLAFGAQMAWVGAQNDAWMKPDRYNFKRTPDFTFAGGSRFRPTAAEPSLDGFFKVPSNVPGAFPTTPMFRKSGMIDDVAAGRTVSVAPFDVAAPAQDSMIRFTEVLGLQGDAAVASAGNIADRIKQLLSFTAAPQIQMPATPQIQMPATPDVNSDAPFAGSSRFRPTGAGPDAAQDSMTHFNETLRQQGDAAVASAGNIADHIKQLLSFTAAPQIQMPATPQIQMPATPDVNSDAPFAGSSRFRPTGAGPDAAQDSMTHFNETLRQQGDAAVASAGNIADHIKQLLSFTAAPQIQMPATPDVKSDAFAGSSRFRPTTVDPAAAQDSMARFIEILRQQGDAAVAVAGNIADRIRQLLSFTATPQIQMPSAPGVVPTASQAPAVSPTAPGRSSGGAVYEGGIYRVAEHRDEYFAPGQDGTIFPDLGTASGDRTAIGPITIGGGTYHFHGVSDLQAVAQEVVSKVDATLAAQIRGIFSDYGVELRA